MPSSDSREHEIDPLRVFQLLGPKDLNTRGRVPRTLGSSAGWTALSRRPREASLKNSGTFVTPEPPAPKT